MRGRPARKPDPELSRALDEAMRGRGLSATAVASALEVSVTTITRSLASGAFSARLRGRLLAFLHADDERMRPADFLQTALLKLMEAGRIQGEAERAVRSALDRLGPAQ